MVETGGLEIRYGLTVIGGSNPSPSATFKFNNFLSLPLNSYNPFIYNGNMDLMSRHVH